ncbi:MAG TPA: VTT domain-containing protein [Chloroflexota bacterium]|jgi:membrane-associated protein|nr:VTT domain-containing protein [Chloroflexota bacterium]
MLTYIATAGYAAISIAVLLGALGAPLPLGVALATMGAFARQGHLHISLLFLCAVSAAVFGDTMGYLAGRHLLRRMPLPTRPGHATQRLLAWITEHGHLGLLIFLTRWSLTAPATAINLLAGYRRYRWRTFVLIDLAGQALWVALALLPGYLLGAHWNWEVDAALGLVLLFSLLGSWLFQRWLARHAHGLPAVGLPQANLRRRQAA